MVGHTLVVVLARIQVKTNSSLKTGSMVKYGSDATEKRGGSGPKGKNDFGCWYATKWVKKVQIQI